MTLDALCQNVASQLVPLSPRLQRVTRALGPPAELNCALKPVPKTEIKDVPDDGVAETDRTLLTMTCAAMGPVSTPGEGSKSAPSASKV